MKSKFIKKISKYFSPTLSDTYIQVLVSFTVMYAQNASYIMIYVRQLIILSKHSLCFAPFLNVLL